MKDFRYNAYMSASDKLIDVIPETIKRFNKYFSDKVSVKIFGYDKLEEKIKTEELVLPSNWSFISMGEDRGSEYWVEDLHKAFSSVDDKFFLWFIDDTWIDSKVDIKTIDELCSEHIDEKTNWFGLSEGPSKREHTIEEEFDGFNVIKLSQQASYRVTCQFNIWNRERLLYFLSISGRDSKNMKELFPDGLTDVWWKPGEPWHWEHFGQMAAYNDGYDIYAFDGNMAVKTLDDVSRREQ